MEPLYKLTNKYTYEEYKKFNSAVIMRKKTLVITIIAVLMILIGGILLESLFLILFAIIYPILFVLFMNIGVKRVYNSNKILKDLDVNFEFYDDCFIVKHEAGEAKIPYDKLNEIIETKTNFYLMIAKNQGYMVLKENMPEGFEEFIKSKK
jgi:hypothetical protein